MNRTLFIRSILVLLVAGVTALAVSIGAVYLLGDRQGAANVSGQTERSFAEPGTVPIGGSFTLVDHTGKTVTDGDFRGKFLLVFFGFTNCPDVCPTTLAEMARTIDLLGNAADAVAFLFVSVDPERDTPAVMAEYVKAFDPRITGLTGSLEQVDAMAKTYRVAYEKTPAGAEDSNGSGSAGDDDYLISHQANTYLMSRQGEYLTHFSYGTVPEKMAETIREAISRFGDGEGEN
ncbi:SCO family protein [Nitratireductor rhodophyticola]|uniref:SCO family protein n=1 Tax=Nitratireductor rhodophyticola TaxID=2854036 RepID=UPI003008EA50